VFPFGVVHAQDARMYTFALLFSLASFWLLLRALEQPSIGRWAAYAAAVAATGYSHEFALLGLIGQLPLVLVSARRESRNEFALALGSAAILLVPLAVISARNFGADPLYYISAPGLQEVSDTMLLFGGSRPGVAICVLVILSGVVWSVVGWRRRDVGTRARTYPVAGAWLAVCLWLVAPFVVLFLASQLKPLLASRYVFPSSAAACLALALALGFLRLRVAAIVPVVVAALAYGAVQNARALERPDWPAAAEWLARHRLDDRVILVGGQRNAAAVVYYMPSLGIERAGLPWTDAELAALPPAFVLIDRDNDIGDLRAALSTTPVAVVRQGSVEREKQERFDALVDSCVFSDGADFRGITIRVIVRCP
jgi:hypothetical protein